MEIDAIIKNIEEKLGEENKDLIVDDIAQLYTLDKEQKDTIANKDTEINDIKSRNETLTKVNANLLKSVPAIQVNEVKLPEAKEEDKPFSWRDQFDSKGNFIK